MEYPYFTKDLSYWMLENSKENEGHKTVDGN